MSSSKEQTVATLDSKSLSIWVEQRFHSCAPRHDPELTHIFENILWAANQYVPSECGSICLGGFPDAPMELVYVASFGESANLMPGTRLLLGQGITGKVYVVGEPMLRNDVSKDSDFYSGVDQKTHFVTRSLLAVPILVDEEVVGVLSLVNRHGKAGFRRHDLRLMEIFCGYLSTSIRNLIDAQFHRDLAQRDYLSGLFNDRYFYRHLLAEIEGCERYGGDLGLIFMDLDHFKSVVDTHGHLVGSQVLAEVGQLLARTVDHPGATLVRYGGDEYVAVLPGANSERALEVAEKIRLAILESVFLSTPGYDGRPPLNLQGHFTASLGVASYRECHFHSPLGDTTVRRQEFIRIADESMYAAKRLGKNRVHLGKEKASS